MRVSHTTASISLTVMAVSFAVLFGFGDVLQLREAVVPEVAQPGAQLGQAFGPGAVQTSRAGSSLVDQTGLAQDAQVLRNGGAGDVRKARGDLAGGVLAVSNEAQDGHAARFAQR